MKFQPDPRFNGFFRGLIALLIILSLATSAYAGWFFFLSPHPGTTTKQITYRGTLGYTGTSHISQVDFIFQTYDAFTIQNPIQMNLTVTLNNLNDIKSAGLVRIPGDFDPSVLSTQSEIIHFLMVETADNVLLNLTRTPMVTPETVKQNFNTSLDAQFTFFGWALLKNGTFEKDWVPGGVLTISPYSELVGVQTDRLVTQNIVVQTAQSDVMLSLTLAVTGFTLAQIVELKPTVTKKGVDSSRKRPPG